MIGPLQGLRAPRSEPRLVLGPLVVLIGVGYGAFRFVGGGFETQFELLIPILGGILGSAMMGEYVAPQSRGIWYQAFLLPAIEILTTYALLGVAILAFYSGLVTAGAVSGLLLVFGFLAVVLTTSRLHELYTEIGDGDSNAQQPSRGTRCALCGEVVDSDRAIPNDDGEPCHRDCWDDAHGAPDWMGDDR